MNIRKSFVDHFRFIFLGIPLFFGFFIKEYFKRDIYKVCIDYLEDLTGTKDSDLGFFFIIQNTELNILKTSFKLKFLIIIKFWEYGLKNLKKEIDDEKL